MPLPYIFNYGYNEITRSPKKGMAKSHEAFDRGKGFALLLRLSLCSSERPGKNQHSVYAVRSSIKIVKVI